MIETLFEILNLQHKAMAGSAGWGPKQISVPRDTLRIFYSIPIEENIMNQTYIKRFVGIDIITNDYTKKYE